VTHNSDGEQTRPYTGPSPADARWSGPPAPPALPPHPGWAHPPVGGWPAHPGGPPHTRGGAKALRWTVIGLVVVAVVAAAVAVRMTSHGEAAPTSGAAPGVAPSPSATSAGSASPSASTAPTSSTSSPAVGSGRLGEFLPSATTLESMLIVEKLVQITDTDSLYTTSTTDRPDCGGVINVGLPTAYGGSGYSAVRLQEFHDVPGDQYEYGVTQAVSTFPTDEKARAFVSTEADRWAKCKYNPVTLIDRGAEAFVNTILTPETNAGVLTVSTLSKSYSGLGCQRALSSKRNVVIDVQICGPGGSAQAPSLVAQIADRIPTT
jgi:PknH-like extracellular domain